MTKKVVNFSGEEKCTQSKSWLRIRKGPPPYVGMGPRMVNPALMETSRNHMLQTFIVFLFQNKNQFVNIFNVSINDKRW